MRRAISDIGAPAASSSAATRSVRGVTLGCWKLAVSMTTPAIRSRRDGTVERVERHAEPRHQQRDHLARGRRPRVDPVHGPEADVRDVVVDVHDRHAPEQLGVLPGDPADPRQVAAVADHDEVVVEVRVGLRRKRSMRGMKSYIAGTGSALSGVARPPSYSTASATPSAEPNASASGFSWPMASTRRAARRRSTTSAGTAARSPA